MRGPLLLLSRYLCCSVIAVLASCGGFDGRFNAEAAFVARSSSSLHPSGPRTPTLTSPTPDRGRELYLFDFFKPKEPSLSSPQESNRPPSSSSPKQPPSPPAVTEEPDLVEKVFRVFFGQPEEKPLGLSRFNQDRFPEQYPAVVDVWADPVPTDDKEVAMIRPLLKNTSLERRGLRLTYDANRQGWSPMAFHGAVDRQGPAVVVCTTRDGLTVGGYNPKGWVGYGEARSSIAAFLFRLKNDGKSWIKLRKIGGASFAQVDKPETGPSFGVDSLVILLAKDSPQLARSKLGNFYERLPGNEGVSLFGSLAPGSSSNAREGAAQLKSLKVYHGVYQPGEFVPFTDAEPFALY